MKKVLLTGGTGFIGSHTAIEVIKSGYDVIIVDDLSNSEESVIDRVEQITNVRPIFYRADVKDGDALETIFSEHDINAVIHFAGFKAVGESVEKPLQYYCNNLNTALTLLKVMKEFRVRDLIFSSSATVLFLFSLLYLQYIFLGRYYWLDM